MENENFSLHDRIKELQDLLAGKRRREQNSPGAGNDRQNAKKSFPIQAHKGATGEEGEEKDTEKLREIIEDYKDKLDKTKVCHPLLRLRLSLPYCSFFCCT